MRQPTGASSGVTFREQIAALNTEKSAPLSRRRHVNGGSWGGGRAASQLVCFQAVVRSGWTSSRRLRKNRKQFGILPPNFHFPLPLEGMRFVILIPALGPHGASVPSQPCGKGGRGAVPGGAGCHGIPAQGPDTPGSAGDRAAPPDPASCPGGGEKKPQAPPPPHLCWAGGNQQNKKMPPPPRISPSAKWFPKQWVCTLLGSALPQLALRPTA